MNDLINSEKTKSYEFEGFTLSGALKELKQGESVVDIQRRVLDLLTFLIENRHRTVSKDEIQDAVWPGTVVTEAALTRAVMKARKALDDDATRQRFIKTVHGQGYRFVADIAEVEQHESTDPVDHQQRRQALLRVATTYGAGAWLVNQAASMVWEAFEWVRWPQQILLAVSLLGFPLALVFTWFYSAGPKGVMLRSEVRGRSFSKPATRWERPVIAMLLLALGLMVFWNLRSEPAPAASRIAVLPINNLTGDSSLSWLSLGMLSLLNTQLTDSDVSTVSAGKIISAVGEARQEVSAELLEQLRATQGAKYVFNIAVAAAGEEYKTASAYFDEGQRFELPSFTGATPVDAVRALGRHMVGMLNPQRTKADISIASGDIFVDQAFARGMHELLSGNQQRAKDLLEVAANAAPESFWPHYELVVAMRMLGNLQDAQRAAVALLHEARRLGEAVQIATLSNELGVIADLTGDLDASQQHYEEGLQWAEQAALHDRKAALLINYAILERARANPTRAQSLLGRAVTAYQDAGIELLPGDLYITLGNAAADAGDYLAAQKQYRQALNNFRVVNRSRGEGIALANLSWASEQLGDMQAALQYLQESEVLRASIDDQVGVIRSQIRRADLYYGLGRLDEVIEVVQNVAATEYVQQEQEILATTHRFQAAVATDRGQYELALDLYSQAISLDEAGGRIRAVFRSQIGVANTLLKQVRFDEALTTAHTLEEGSRARSIANVELQARHIKAKILNAQGNQQEAISVLATIADDARQLGNVVEVANVAVSLSDIYYRLGNKEALEAWVGVAQDAQPHHARVKLAQAQLAVLNLQWSRAQEYIDAARALQGERIASACAALQQVVDEAVKPLTQAT